MRNGEQVWSAIYALCAELLSLEWWISLEADRIGLIREAVTAAWRWASAS